MDIRIVSDRLTSAFGDAAGLLGAPAHGVQVPARTIPVPTTISKQAQAFLARDRLFPALPDLPDLAPDDVKGWRRHVEKINIGLTRTRAERARAYPAVITPRVLSSSVLYIVEPQTKVTRAGSPALLYFHGGGYAVGSGIAAAYAAQPIASETGLLTFALDYRMVPDHPYPAALDDAIEAYRHILKRRAPGRIVVVGDSSGAGLAAALVLKARDIGLPMPAAVVLHTPDADLTDSGDTFQTNQHVDVVLNSTDRPSRAGIKRYADGHDLTDPYLSPVMGDFAEGFPPTMLSSGTRDLFLSNTVRMHRALRRAGVESELHVMEAMPHGGFFGAPEDKELRDEQVRFIHRRLKISRA